MYASPRLYMLDDNKNLGDRVLMRRLVGESTYTAYRNWFDRYDPDNEDESLFKPIEDVQSAYTPRYNTPDDIPNHQGIPIGLGQYSTQEDYRVTSYFTKKHYTVLPVIESIVHAVEFGGDWYFFGYEDVGNPNVFRERSALQRAGEKPFIITDTSPTYDPDPPIGGTRIGVIDMGPGNIIASIPRAGNDRNHLIRFSATNPYVNISRSTVEISATDVSVYYDENFLLVGGRDITGRVGIHRFNDSCVLQWQSETNKAMFAAQGGAIWTA